VFGGARRGPVGRRGDIYRVGVGAGVFGVGDILGIGDMLGVGDIDGIDGICPIGIFMSFIMEAQRSAIAAFMESQQPECAKKRRYTPATMMKMPTAMPVMARAGLSQRVQVAEVGAGVVDVVSVIALYLSCGVVG
jgi:hypothetical protein